MVVAKIINITTDKTGQNHFLDSDVMVGLVIRDDGESEVDDIGVDERGK